jgi:anaerobic dimethyl sulfoxide reductase subunit C (anchor subunit)
VFITWVVTGVALPLVALGLMFAVPVAALALAVVAWLSCAGGIAAWTVLFFKGAHKVKLFPMYPVDLNLDM